MLVSHVQLEAIAQSTLCYNGNSLRYRSGTARI
jgi:hypothetical protein